MTERLHFHFSLSCIGEGNGNPLQWSCLENLRDGGAWWAVIYGVTQSPTRLKRLSSSSGGLRKKLLDFPGGPIVKNPLCNARDTSSILDPKSSHMPWGNSGHVPQLMSLSFGAHRPQLLSPCATTTEACAP